MTGPDGRLRRGHTLPVARLRTKWPAVTLCCISILVGLPVSANASLLSRNLVTEGSPMEGQEAQAVATAGRDAPEAHAARERSRTEFMHLNAPRAARLAREVFPVLIERTAGGPPQLSSGGRIIRYVGPNAAQLDLPDGKHGVVESLQPMARAVAPGRFSPIDLALAQGGASYAPEATGVPVEIPKRLAGGVRMPDDGVSLTPIDARGAALTGAGTQDGTAVLYANTQADTDTVAKPTATGFEIDTLLRSAASPSKLYFRVGMPAGARLVSRPGSSAVEVVERERALADILAPYAQDVTGASVPVSVSVSGDILALAVAETPGEYQYPIAVDPLIKDPHINDIQRPTNWRFVSTPSTGGKFVSSGWTGEGGLTLSATGTYTAQEAGMLIYPQREGTEAWIYETSVIASTTLTGTNAVAPLQLENKSKAIEGEQVYSKTESDTGISVRGECRNHQSECSYSERGTAGNAARFALRPTEAGSGARAVVEDATVYIDQEKGPTVSFDTSREYVDGGRRNVLYGEGAWLGPHSGAFVVQARDPGVGIDLIGATTLGWSVYHNFMELGECVGVQCDPEVNEDVAYNSKMKNGEWSLEASACDVAGEAEYECPHVTGGLKVDGTPPRELKLTGLPEKNEFSDDLKYTLKAEATDGTKPTPSSGIKSLELLMDGREFGKPTGSCAPGECTAHAEWALGFEAVGAGQHTLTLVATDNAGNVETESFTVVVRHASPVALGPGQVTPVTGEFDLAASDVSIDAPPAASLTVRRNYGSRRITAGEFGPLGPQWTLSLGANESLDVASDGNVELLSGDGQNASFVRGANKAGTVEFEAPKSDANLTLEGHEHEAGKGITEYLLKNSSQGSVTKFEPPGGEAIETEFPAYSNEFGAKGLGTDELEHPTSIAEGADGDLWVTDNYNDRLEVFGPGGEFLKTVGSDGAGNDELSDPSGIAIDAKGDVWVADTDNNRVDEFNEAGEFQAAFGYGVSNGEAKFEVCTSSCEGGIKGSAKKGQFNLPEGVAVDAHGNVWVADSANNRLEEFNEKREFVQVVGAAGTKAGDFEDPTGLSFDSHGNLWVSDSTNDRIDKFNEKGEFLFTVGYGVSNGEAKLETCTASCKVGKAGSGSGQLDDPYGLTTDANGNVWVGDAGNSRVQIFSEQGAYVNKFGSNGSGAGQFGSESVGKTAQGLGMARVGNVLWITDTVNGRLETWTSPGPSSTWEPTISEGPAPTDTVSYAYKMIIVKEKPVIVPAEELGSKPAGVKNCPEEEPEKKAEQGCRELTFTYGAKTGQLGERESEWGEYEGRLMKVLFTAYNPVTKAEQTKTVAEYAYDQQGRLRAEWNPQISPALKTVYGYDSEGHVTALTPPGREPWVFTYGAIAGDPSTGRLLKARQAPASAKTRQAEAPSVTEAPSLSGDPVVGIRMAVSSGHWSDEPTAYAYQWESEALGLGEWETIPGATNANYTPATKDENHVLRVRVTAINGDGAVSTFTAVSGVVHTSSSEKVEGELHAPEPGETVEYHVPVSGAGAYAPNLSAEEVEKWGQQQQEDPVEGTAIFPSDEPQGWPASDYRRATIYYLDGEDQLVNVASPDGGSTPEHGGAVSTFEYNAQDDVVRTLNPDNRASALREGCKSKTECRSAEVSKLLDTKEEYDSEGNEVLETTGPQHTIRLANGSEVQARDVSHNYYDENAPGGETYHLVTKTTSAALVNGKEEEPRTVITSYGGGGWSLRKPTMVTTDPNGLNLKHTTVYYPSTGAVKETTTPTGAAENAPPAYAAQFGSGGSGNGQFNHPVGVAVDASGNVWVVDAYNNRVEKFSSAGAFLAAYGKEGSSETEAQFREPVGIAINQKSGNLYVSDQNNNRVVELSSTGSLVRVFGKAGTGHGEFKEPGGIAIDAKGDVWVVDSGNDRVQEFSESGTYMKEFGSAGSGEGQLNNPASIAIAGEDIYVTDLNNSRVEEFGEEGGKFVRVFGSWGSGNGQFEYPTGIAVAPNGNVYVADDGNARVQEFTSAGTFLLSFGGRGAGNGQFAEPEGLAMLASGALYVTDAGANNRVQEFVSNSGGAHTTRTVYYTAQAEAEITACQNHREWAGLVCQSEPAGQPVTGDLPNLPVKTYTYNFWDEPETISETVGAAKRTQADVYEPSGRLEKTTISSSVGTALPPVTYAYNGETGMLEKQSTTSEGKTKTITSTFNTLGELADYTDADEASTSYEYDEDGRVKKVNDGKGIETYTYGKITGLPEELVNEYGTTKLTFTATYDAEGKMLSEGYSNGMTASYAYNAIGQPASVTYVKNVDCAEKCPETWFKDEVAQSAQGQTASQVSSLATDYYTYDNAGRLTEVQETPVGKKCVARLYGYDEDTNRTSETKRECSGENAQVENHSYDSADRLTDQGVEYNTMGDITKLPASDANGEPLTGAFYADNQLLSQEQGGETIGYNLDPAFRTRETVSTGRTVADVIDHYAGPGEGVSWTANTSGEVSRNIMGIDGDLAATQSNTETPVLQIANLHGDIVAKASASETATKLSSTYNTTEFGVPSTSLPPKYAWLGAIDLPTSELTAGTIAMGVRSYVPSLGRFLQPDPVPGGSANAYTYVFGDPLDQTDPSGEWTFMPTWLRESDDEWDTREAAVEAARLAAERAEAERLQRQAEEIQAYYASIANDEGEEWEEWEEWEEGEEYEYASYPHGAKPEDQEGRLGSGVLVQSLGEAATSMGGGGSVVSLCKAGVEGPCASQAAECNDHGKCHGGASGHHGRRSSPHVGRELCEAGAAIAGGPCGSHSDQDRGEGDGETPSDGEGDDGGAAEMGGGDFGHEYR